MRKLRYAAAIFCGAAFMSAAVLTSCSSTAKTDTETKDVTVESEGASGSMIHREESGNPDDDPDRSTEESEETLQETSTEPEQETSREPEADESTVESGTEEEETAPEDDSDAEKDSALRQFFEHKLIVNPDKVELYLNVREEPDDDSAILSVLYPNDIAVYTGKTGNWYEIEREGYNGYVNAGYVYTDDEAYEAMRHSIAYAAMVQTYESYLYGVPDTSTEIVLCAHKSDTFRLKGITDGFYEVKVKSDIYDTLFMPADDAIVFYLFLGQGNKNELTEEQERLFETLDVGDNLERSRELIAEYAEDLQEYKDFLSSSEESSWIAEQEYLACSESAMQAYLEASAQAEEAYRAASEEAEQAYIASSWAEHQAYVEASWEAEQAYIASSRQAEQEAQQQAWASASQAAAESAAAAQAGQASAAAEAAQQSGEAQYLGNFYITRYCHCTICCGVWGSDDPNYDAHGSSGMRLQENYTVAVDPRVIPYGTRLLINGQEYLAADSGPSGNIIDIYMRTHEGALSVGCYYADVYVLP